MKVSNNTGAPQLILNWKHLILVLLHLGVFIHLVLSQELITAEVRARALPHTLLYERS